MAKRRTTLLVLLLAPAALCALLAFFRMEKVREDAAVSRQSLADARRDLEEIRRWRSSPGRAAAVSMETPQLNAKLREAATAAGLTDAPGSEANAPQRLGGTDYSETTVYLRPEPLTMRQLTTFLVTLARIEPSARVKTIELSDPQAQGVAVPPGRGQNGEDVWVADLTVAYLTYTPQQKK
jgi:hypothetical protein